MKRSAAILIIAGILKAQAPPFSTFDSNYATQMAQIRASVANKSWSKITFSGQHHPLNYNWFTLGSPATIGLTGTCNPSATAGSGTDCKFANITKVNAWTDGPSQRFGMKGFEWNVDLRPLATTANYVPANATNVTTFVGNGTVTNGVYNGGLNDCTFTGPFTGLAPQTYVWNISTAGGTDHATWGTVGPDTYLNVVLGNDQPITLAPMPLSAGISVTCKATTGHTAGDQWIIRVLPSDAGQGAGSANQWFTRAQAVMDSAVTYAINTDGLFVNFRPKWDGMAKGDCGWTGNIVAADWIACALPLYIAAIDHYKAQIHWFSFAHEAAGGGGNAMCSGTNFTMPTAICASAVALKQAAIQTFINTIGPLARAENVAVKAGIKFSADTDTVFAADAGIFTNVYLGNSNLDNLGFDWYESTFDVTQYCNAPSMGAACNSGSVVGLINTWSAQAIAHNQVPWIAESERPKYGDPAATPPGENNAIYGCANPIYSNYAGYDADTDWYYTAALLASVDGIANFSRFVVEPLFWYTPNPPPNDNCQTGTYPLDIMSNLSLTSSTGTFLLQNLAPIFEGLGAISITGNVTINGNVH